MRNKSFFLFSPIIPLVLAAVFGSFLIAQAATRSWSSGATDRLASNSANWSGGVTPSSGEAISLPSGSAVTWDLSGTVPASLTTSADLTLQTPLIISGALHLTGGTLKLNGQPLNVGGDLSIEGGTLDASGAPVNVSGSWTYASGALSLAASTVTMNGTGSKTVTSGGQHFGGLAVSSDGATVSLADDLNVDNALNIIDGTLEVGGKTLIVQGGVAISGGALSIGSGKIVLSGTAGRPLNVSGGSFNAASSSTVEYHPVSGSVTVEPLAYGNLKVAGNSVFSLLGDTTVNGSLSVAADATLSLGGHVLNVPGGTMTVSGAVTDGVVRCPARALRVLSAAGADLSSIRSASGTITVSVEDWDLNRQGAAIENIPMAVTVTTLGGDKETLGIKETSVANGLFKSDALVIHQGTPAQGNGQIELGQSDIVFVTYADPQDPSDTKSLQLNVALAGASSSGQPQIVAGPSLSAWNGLNTGSGTTYSAHVLWTTDVVSTSAVTVTSPQLTAPISTGNLTGTTDHDVVVSGLIRGRDYYFTVTSVSANGASVTSKAKPFVIIVSGDRIKTAATSAVYWYLEGKRNVFPDFTSYDSWFADWNGVITVPAEQMSDIQLGKVVPIRAGTYLVKIQSDPKTYAVEPFGKLRWIPTEAQAIALYGKDWSRRVRDVDVSQFASYSSGDQLATGDVPSGFVYKTGGGEMGTVLDKTARPLSESARQANGIFSRFVSTIVPSLVSSLSSGGATGGYDPDLNGVYLDGNTRVVAPAFGS